MREYLWKGGEKMINLAKIKIPLTAVVDGANLILVDVSPYYAYVDGKKTDNQLGHKYLVVEDKNFDKFFVKVPSATPIITSEQLSEAKQRIMVTFENGVARPYRTQNGEYDLSITATAVAIAK